MSIRINRRKMLAGMAGLGLAPGVLRAQDPTTRLILLGTQGGPNFNPLRNESANAIVVDGKTYLVDCGYGALGAIRRAGLSYRDIGDIFLTHLHDDHTADLAALLSHQWTDGRIEPTHVVGPFGTERLVDAALEFGRANTEIRLIDEDRSVLPAEMFSGRDIEATAAPTEIFADDRVTVSSVENTHYPESATAASNYRAVSYRFDSRDRSIVISGDTNYSENLIRLAEGADVFVCEAMEYATTRADFERRVAGGAYADNAEGIWQHIADTHTTTEDAGRMAALAGVKTLVLTHLLPGGLLEIPDETYIEGVRLHFEGEVIIGQDLLEI